jgi:arylsulfatase A-like enzyme
MAYQKPHILFIILDTHRVDRLGCYNYDRGTSPNLDAFAERATLFERAISPAQWTIPSHASMFSGEFPSTHKTVQASSALPHDFTTLAEYLSQTGYVNTGFCNNPLVGVLENGLRRGFDHFYNYGGAMTSAPPQNGYVPRKLISGLRKGYRQIIERISVPIQQAVAGSPDIFNIFLNPKLVAWWTRFANFKGDGAASIEHTANHLKKIFQQESAPQFTFLNLMGTHLPYTPPDNFISDFAPIINEAPEAAAFMQDYNTRAFHWLLPMKEPYTELEAKTLSDMYDAEVAHQDHLLAQILCLLDDPEVSDNTLVIIASDHGEMLGEHNLMGHGIGLYQELIHVPLMIRFPGQKTGTRVKQPVSTTYLFHTILEAAGVELITPTYSDPIATQEFSLRNLASSMNHSPRRVFSEGYPPMNLIKIIERHEPAIMDEFNCESTRWAAFDEAFKLLRIDQVRDDLFNLKDDPLEIFPQANDVERVKSMGAILDDHLAWANSRATGNMNSQTRNLHDKDVLERMRGLGYIE